MAIQHPVYCQRQRDGKVILVTIVTDESVGMTSKDSMIWFIATTDCNNPYTGKNPTITLDHRSKCDSKKYVDILNKAVGLSLEHTKGMGINGIIRGAYWFIRPFKSIFEQMFGR